MSRSRTVLLLSGGLLLILGMLWGQGVFSAVSTPPPTVGTPVAQPSTLVVNQTTRLTVTSRITSSPRPLRALPDGRTATSIALR